MVAFHHVVDDGEESSVVLHIASRLRKASV